MKKNSGKSLLSSMPLNNKLGRENTFGNTSKPARRLQLSCMFTVILCEIWTFALSHVIMLFVQEFETSVIATKITNAIKHRNSEMLIRKKQRKRTSCVLLPKFKIIIII